MSVEMKCAYCEKPLVDAEHARHHVAHQCAKAPDWRKALGEASRLIFIALPHICDKLGMHAGLPEKMREFLEKHPYDPGHDGDAVN